MNSYKYLVELLHCITYLVIAIIIIIIILKLRDYYIELTILLATTSSPS